LLRPASSDPEPDALPGDARDFSQAEEGERPVEVLVVVVVAAVVLRVILDGCLNARRIADRISRYLEAPHGPTRRDRPQQ
jgi:hypothetical protein